MTDSKTVVEDLAAWLTAVWDEEERRELANRTWRSDAPPMDVTTTHDGEGVLVSNPGSSIRHWLSAEEYERLYLTPSPDKQVLARVAADRKILAAYLYLAEGTGPLSDELAGQLKAYGWAVQYIAEAHRDRPGFRSEWLVERQGVER